MMIDEIKEEHIGREAKLSYFINYLKIRAISDGYVWAGLNTIVEAKGEWELKDLPAPVKLPSERLFEIARLTDPNFGMVTVETLIQYLDEKFKKEQALKGDGK